MKFTKEENLARIHGKMRRKRIWNISSVCCLILAIFLLFSCSFTIYQKPKNSIKFLEMSLDAGSGADISANMVKQNVQELLPWLPEVSLENEDVRDERAYQCVNQGCMDAGFEHYEIFSSSDETDLLLSISTDNRGPITYWDVIGVFDNIMENKEKSFLEGYDVWLIKDTEPFRGDVYILYTKIHDYYVYLEISGNYTEEEFILFGQNFLKSI